IVLAPRTATVGTRSITTRIRVDAERPVEHGCPVMLTRTRCISTPTTVRSDGVSATDSNGGYSVNHDTDSGGCGKAGGTWVPGYVDENSVHFNTNNGQI